MDGKQRAINGINRVAEVQFAIRPMLVNTLSRTNITHQGSPLMLGAKTYLEFWEKSLSNKFYDMSTLVNLGSNIEGGFKHYYMDKMNIISMSDLIASRGYKKNIFQRVLPWTQGDTCITIYKSNLNIDLTTLNNFDIIQHIFHFRHLYAHNNGIIDDEFIQKHLRLTGVDLMPHVSQQGYPNEDVYYFKPLDSLSNFIEKSRSFFRNLP